MKRGRSWFGKPLGKKITDLKEFGKIARGFNQGEFDPLDPSTLLDGLNIATRVIPGMRLPFSIQRESEGSFDWLAPVPNRPGYYDDRKSYKSPFDCEKWPDSPFCKNPLEQLGHKPLGIDVEIAYTDCEVCIRTTYDFAWFRFPAYTKCWRKPDCVKDEEPPEDQPLPLPSPPPNGEAPPCRGCKPLPTDFESSLWGAYRVVKSKQIFIEMPECSVEGFRSQSAYDTSGSYSGSGLYGNLPIPLEDVASFNWGSAANQEKYNYLLIAGEFSPLAARNSYWWIVRTPFAGRFRRPTQQERAQATSPLPEIIWDGYDPNDFGFIDQHFYTPARSRVEIFSSGRWSVFSAGEFDKSPYVNYLGYTDKCKPKGNPLSPYKIGPGLLWTDKPQKRPLPPPPAPHNKTMDCCSDLEEKLDFMIRRLGLKIYPMVVQKDLTKEEDKELDPGLANENAQKLSDDALNERGLVKLEDMTNLLAWQSFNTLKTMGDFPFEVSTTTDEGQQEQATFGNLRQAIQFMAAKQIATGFDADNCWSAIQLVLYEQAQGKAALQKTVDLLLAICQAIGFRLESEKKEIQIPFTLPEGETTQEIASKLDTYPVKDLLKPRTAQVASFRNDDPNMSVFRTLGQVERAAKLAAAAATEVSKQDDGSDAVQRLRALADLMLGKRKPQEDAKENEDWDAQLAAIELILNDYLKANGAPAIKIRSTEQRTEVPPTNAGG